MAPKNRQRRTGRSRRRGPVRRIQNLKDEVKGRALRVPWDPPTIIGRPWNHDIFELSTYVSNNSAGAIITVQRIWDSLLEKLGLDPKMTNPPQMEFRFQKVQCWTLHATGANAPDQVAGVQLSVYDVFSVDPASSVYEGNAIYEAHDRPGKNHWAAVGYAYPISYTNRVVDTFEGAGGKLVLTRFAPIGGESGTFRMIVRIHYLWRKRTLLDVGLRNISYETNPSDGYTNNVVSHQDQVDTDADLSRLTLDDEDYSDVMSVN